MILEKNETHNASNQNRSEELYKYLKNSPVFAGSLGSKELFHSNIWAYLIEQNQQFMNVFFINEEGKEKIFDPNVDQIKKDKKTEELARREKLNLDLLVVTEDKIFVIENKIKSLPRIEQLKRYEESIRKHFPGIKDNNKHFLLTGIRDKKPSYLIGMKNWKYKSYHEISDGIRKELESCEKEQYYSYAKEYCDVIDKLSELIQLGVNDITNKYYFAQFIDADKNVYPNADLLSKITRLGLGDIFQKLNADRFVQKVQQEEIETKGLSQSLSGLICNSGFTHGNSLAEFFFEEKKEQEEGSESKQKKDLEEYVRIGVQIQETQFRWYIETRTKERKKEDDIYKVGKEELWFFEKKANKITCPTSIEPETTMTKPYCLFKTTNNTFVYQYYNIVEAKCAFTTLSDEVISFLMIAKKNILAIKEKILE